MPASSPSTSRSESSKPRGRFDATVEFNRFICREHYLLRVRINPDGPAFPATEPGQFVQLGCRPPNGAMDETALFGRDLEWQPGERPALRQAELCGGLAMLRRPFSLAGRGDDERGTWLDVIHRVVGVGTAWLAALQPGDAVDLIGPLGNRFELPAGKSLGLLVGGGVGLPPMFYLAEAMQRAGWNGVGFVGALTRDLLAVSFDDKTPVTAGRAGLSVVEFARCGYPTVITTDDGTLGLKGRITAGLSAFLETMSKEDAARTVVFTCGPEPMMHAVADLAAARDIDGQVCLEQSMACGMGTCQSCIVRIEAAAQPHGETEKGRPWRFKLACTDGPVFDAKNVVW